MDLTTDQKGGIAEMAIAWAAIKLGIGFKPLTDGHRYDLIFDTRPHLFRVQCKWAVKRGDVIVVNCRTCRRGADGFIRSSYNRDEVDLIAAYCGDLDQCYVIPPTLFDGRPAVSLRLAPARNNQRAGIRWARDHELERLDFVPLGAVAQLGERMPGRHEVTGSSPVGSTS